MDVMDNNKAAADGDSRRAAFCFVEFRSEAALGLLQEIGS